MFPALGILVGDGDGLFGTRVKGGGDGVAGTGLTVDGGSLAAGVGVGWVDGLAIASGNCPELDDVAGAAAQAWIASTTIAAPM